jgi:hypothetical protein
MNVINFNANIYLNRQCLIKKIVPSYTKIKIPHTAPAAASTKKKAQVQRIKDEIRFLYKNK